MLIAMRSLNELTLVESLSKLREISPGIDAVPFGTRLIRSLAQDNG